MKNDLNVIVKPEIDRFLMKADKKACDLKSKFEKMGRLRKGGLYLQYLENITKELIRDSAQSAGKNVLSCKIKLGDLKQYLEELRATVLDFFELHIRPDFQELDSYKIALDEAKHNFSKTIEESLHSIERKIRAKKQSWFSWLVEYVKSINVLWGFGCAIFAAFLFLKKYTPDFLTSHHISISKIFQ